MSKPHKKEPLGPSVLETYNVLGTAAGLLVCQVVLNLVGFGGLTTTIIMYAFATMISAVTNYWYAYDERKGFFLQVNPDKNLTGYDYLKRAGMDILFILLGGVLWTIFGLWQGVDSMARLSAGGDAILLKLLYIFVSHVTLFSFVRFWTNLFHSIFGTGADDKKSKDKKNKKDKK